MYALINREGVVVDILKTVRYIRLQSNASYVIACEEGKGTGVIGSDCDTHYPLISADTQHNANAVRVVEFETIPSEVKPYEYKLDTETNALVYRYTLEEAQAIKQEANKVAFATYLAAHPMTWVDGKEYGVTEEDQSEIALNLNQYQIAVSAGIETPTLEWHARHEECEPWTIENLSALSLAISANVYPKYHLMQRYKTEIYATTSIEELNAIELNYEPVGDEEE